MKARLQALGAWLVLGLMAGGCTSTPPPDYTNFRLHRPRSILVLPPINQSTVVQGTYGYLSTVTMPLAEMGYYVFPVVMVDQFLRENGMPTAGEMQQVPLDKVAQIIGADAVLYVTLQNYGTKYVVVSSTTTVEATARLVDTRTGLTLWTGSVVAQEGSGGSGNILGDLISAALTQVVNSSTDRAHSVARTANVRLFTVKDRGLLFGPYRPEYDQDK